MDPEGGCPPGASPRGVFGDSRCWRTGCLDDDATISVARRGLSRQIHGHYAARYCIIALDSAAGCGLISGSSVEPSIQGKTLEHGSPCTIATAYHLCSILPVFFFFFFSCRFVLSFCAGLCTYHLIYYTIHESEPSKTPRNSLIPCVLVYPMLLCPNRFASHRIAAPLTRSASTLGASHATREG